MPEQQREEQAPATTAIMSERESSPHQRLRDASSSDPPGIDISKVKKENSYPCIITNSLNYI